jgi:hypothetical protein
MSKSEQKLAQLLNGKQLATLSKSLALLSQNGIDACQRVYI